MQYFVGFVFEADNGCGGKLDSRMIVSCVRNIGVKTFDISHAFLRVTVAELSTLKQVRFF